MAGVTCTAGNGALCEIVTFTIMTTLQTVFSCLFIKPIIRSLCESTQRLPYNHNRWKRWQPDLKKRIVSGTRNTHPINWCIVDIICNPNKMVITMYASIIIENKLISADGTSSTERQLKASTLDWHRCLVKVLILLSVSTNYCSLI